MKTAKKANAPSYLTELQITKSNPPAYLKEDQ
jgi:hypothetical protein